MVASYGKYQLIASLGRGGMADVFLAAASGAAGFRKLIVIKRLREDISDRPSMAIMLLDEAQLAARLQHPNVVQTFEVGTEDGQHYIAMEYLEGQPLGRIMKESGRPPPNFSVRVMVDVLAGLEYAHTLEDYDGRPLTIVHRDVSPQNLFVTYAGETKVVDFGVAKAARRVSDDTEAGVLKGKLGYMSPEQVKGNPVDRRTDVFAAGVVFWELLTGQRLFRGGHDGEAISKILYQPISPPSKIRSDILPALDAIVLKALEREPSQRWQTAGEMREALYAYMDTPPGGGMRRDEVGQYLASHFDAERQAVKAQVSQFMASADEADSSKRDIEALGTLMLSARPPSLMPPPPTPSAPRASYAPPSFVQPSFVPPPAPMPPPAPTRKPSPWRTVIAASAFVGLLLGTVAFVAFGWPGRKPRPLPRFADAAPSASAAPVDQAPAMVLEGSGTLGVEAAPLLLEGFYRKRGAIAVRREPGRERVEARVVATLPRGTETVLVRSEGTNGGFECLAARRCNIAMAAREIHDDEAALLSTNGISDPRSLASEHVVALDGIAIVVHPSSSIRSLDRAQLAALFSGSVVDWSDVGRSTSGAVTLVSHEEVAGTYDVFETLALGGKRIAPSARRLPENAKIDSAVAAEANAIGYLGMTFVRGSRALSIGDRGVAPMVPSPFTVTTERYLLSRRLFFYTPSQPPPLVQEFLDYVLSSEGQSAVRAAGFIDLDVSLKGAEPCDHCSARYGSVTKKARRLSLDFRFRGATKELDARGVRDVERVVRFLREHASSRILLLGFADATSDPKADKARSRDLAAAVDAELTARGVRASVIEGFGGEMPAAANTSDWGRTKNRRVEIWIGP